MNDEPGRANAPAGAPDRIAIRGISARGFHGVLAHERRDGQDFGVDLVLWVSTAAAAGSDDLADTVDYGALGVDVAAVVSGKPVRLIETLAERVADRCLADSRVQAVEVTVHKPQAPIPVPFDDVTVTIHRSRV